MNTGACYRTLLLCDTLWMTAKLGATMDRGGLAGLHPSRQELLLNTSIPWLMWEMGRRETSAETWR
jgi:hypothetical protein